MHIEILLGAEFQRLPNNFFLLTFSLEAVAIGMAFAAKLSVAQSTLSEIDANRLVKLIQKFGLPTSVPDRIKTADLIESMRHDKKSVGGSLRFVLLDGIGASYTKTLEEADVLKALES